MFKQCEWIKFSVSTIEKNETFMTRRYKEGENLR